jgi:hypothetical protein
LAEPPTLETLPMINNSLRAFAASLVLAVPSLALAKAPATEAPAKAHVSTPVKAQTKSASPVSKTSASTPVKASEPVKGADSGEHKKGASKEKGATKKDAAKAGKGDGKTSNDAKH